MATLLSKTFIPLEMMVLILSNLLSTGLIKQKGIFYAG